MFTRLVMTVLVFSCLLLPVDGLSKLSVTLGTEYGFGLQTNVGTPRASLEFGAGFSPYLAMWEITESSQWGSSTENYIKMYLPISAGVKLNLRKSDPLRDRVGYKFGVSYNDLLKVGFGGGMEFQVNKRNRVSIGVMIYPNAYDQLLDRLNEDEGTDYGENDASMVLQAIQPYVAVSIMLGD